MSLESVTNTSFPIYAEFIELVKQLHSDCSDTASDNQIDEIISEAITQIIEDSHEAMYAQVFNYGENYELPMINMLAEDMYDFIAAHKRLLHIHNLSRLNYYQASKQEYNNYNLKLDYFATQIEHVLNLHNDAVSGLPE